VNRIAVHLVLKQFGRSIITELIPGSLSEAKSAVYDQHTVRGRSVPIYGYSHSETRTVDLSLLLTCIDGAGIASTEPPLTTGKDVAMVVNWLKAAAYPIYGGAPIRPPTTVYLKVGSFLEVPDGVITGVSITWGDTYDEAGYPLKAEVALTIEEVQAYPSSAHEVLERGW